MANHRGSVSAVFWALLAALLLASLVAGAAGEPISRRAALVMQVEGAIGPATASYVARGLRIATERGAPLVVPAPRFDSLALTSVLCQRRT
jgi:membrane-bound ClpP family serine protease